MVAHFIRLHDMNSASVKNSLNSSKIQEILHTCFIFFREGNFPTIERKTAPAIHALSNKKNFGSPFVRCDQDVAYST